MNNKTIQCIDCTRVPDTTASICEGCNKIVCEECVYTDHEMYECSKCFEETENEYE